MSKNIELFAVSRKRYPSIVRFCVLALFLGIGTADCAARQGGARERVERKMRQAQEVVPPWVEAGGNQLRAMMLMKAVDRALQNGDLETAEKRLDEVLALAETSPSSSEPTDLERKLREARERIPKWVESGGNQVQVTLLMQEVDEALNDGLFEKAESLLDEVLEIVRHPPSETSRATSIEEKMKKVQDLVPKWIESGGNPVRVMILMQEVDALLADGKVEAAEDRLDEVLAIVGRSPETGSDRVRLRVYEPDGRPTPKNQLTPEFHATIVTGVFPLDVNYNALPLAVGHVEDGIVFLDQPLPDRIMVHFFPRVEGFGQVKVYADNGGEGYTIADGELEIDVPLEATRSRIAKTKALLNTNPAEAFRAQTRERLAAAERRLTSAEDSSPVNARELYAALADALWAGEMATLDVAHHRIAASQPRTDFLFGAALSPNFEEWGETKRKLFRDVFNFATLKTLYLKGYEPSRGDPNPEPTNQQLAWLERHGIAAKGHPLIYLIEPNTPSWLQGVDAAELTNAMVERVVRDVRRFEGRIQFYDVVNEPNNPHAMYTQHEIVDLTKAALQATERADPDAVRIVNVNLPTGDLIADPNAAALALVGKAQTAYQFFQSLEEAGANYDVVGIQMYYPGLDMMEISRMLDRYAKFGRTIHITEIGISSAPGPDPKSEYFQKADSLDAMGEWHGPWSESRQAEWLEQFYTVAYSKPSIEAVSWWDFSDDFWPYGGLLDRDGRPKEAYDRLKHLLESWELRTPN